MIFEPQQAVSGRHDDEAGDGRLRSPRRPACPAHREPHSSAAMTRAAISRSPAADDIPSLITSGIAPTT
jgi:hypothetical protein